MSDGLPPFGRMKANSPDISGFISFKIFTETEYCFFLMVLDLIHENWERSELF